MRVLVPFDATTPKTRLSPALDAAERHALARVLLDDVLAAVRAAGGDPTVVATEPVDADAPVEVDERDLSTCVNDRLDPRPTAVVMADLGLATPAALRRVFRASGDLVVVPGRGAGTNAFVARHPDFRVDYHGGSYLDHLRRAADCGASVREVDSHRLSTDVDEPADLVELLVHGEGRAPGWLRDAGFELAHEGGRLTVRR